MEFIGKFLVRKTKSYIVFKNTKHIKNFSLIDLLLFLLIYGRNNRNKTLSV